jgi:beta-glucuronidase
MLDTIDGLAGFSPWILVDFRSPRRVLPGIEDGFNRKGLISSEGKKKKAFYVLQRYYQKRAQTESVSPGVIIDTKNDLGSKAANVGQ